MANTYTISLPDELKEYADKLAADRRLSEVIAAALTKLMAKETNMPKVNKDGSRK